MASVRKRQLQCAVSGPALGASIQSARVNKCARARGIARAADIHHFFSPFITRVSLCLLAAAKSACLLLLLRSSACKQLAHTEPLFLGGQLAARAGAAAGAVPGHKLSRERVPGQIRQEVSGGLLLLLVLRLSRAN